MTKQSTDKQPTFADVEAVWNALEECRGQYGPLKKAYLLKPGVVLGLGIDHECQIINIPERRVVWEEEFPTSQLEHRGPLEIPR
jgi:hypothetical protein